MQLRNKIKTIGKSYSRPGLRERMGFDLYTSRYGFDIVSWEK
jgi:hypothetical protein